MKTVRFSQVVAACGKPSVHLMLVAPEKDKGLMHLVKKTRVMTIHQLLEGGRKDYGTVGLLKTPGSQLLIFPKSLKPYTDQRIIGINYDLLAGPHAGKTKFVAPKNKSKTGAKTLTDKSRKAEVLPFVPEARPKEEEEATPPTLPEVLAEVQATWRLLNARKLVAGRERLARLIQWIKADPEINK